ncbi:1-acylglycerol-3-phosphate O-acyltransferase [Rhodoferax saidenbachensis]|uniref:1-acyl-sn-glycerol-3-phosphate acyltransferase n=1 Tax=Rhodoferax saidenbachensis TaxID=1484693 RepID=A0ABU1ZM29_9BURK|nr:1-acylglycerol-3-phosphate O-acyltransferase [Rhodoferax saidenbachensis]MDR7306600.1 1-acyl-sn-glycerol-3-phosphate acyltransferase [Rhodoferax saidenbachensis]
MLYLIRLIVLGLYFLVASAINFVICLSRPFNPDNSRLCGWVYSAPALRILGLTVRLETADMLAQPNPFVIVCNHQSNWDLFVLGCAVPRRTVSLGKKSLKWIPFFGQIYWLAGNILIDRGNAFKAKQAMLKTTDVMQHEDTSIWVFPEGTRNLGQGLLPFKKGAFQMAINAGVPIIPLCCSNYKSSMQLNRWHSGTIVIKTLLPIATTGMTLDDMPALMERCRMQMVAGLAAQDVQLS